MYPTGKSGQLQPFTQITHTSPGKKFERRQRGYWERRLGFVENLLCYNCEQKFSKLEDYVKRLFYGNSNPIRIQLPLLDDPIYQADYDKLKLFQLSVLWRASESKGQFFEAVKLSKDHSEKIRVMLLNDAPGRDHEYICSLSRLIVSPTVETALKSFGCAIETPGFAPVFYFDGISEWYTFLMGGISWVYCVSSQGIPEIMKHTYVKESGQFYLLPANGDAFLHQYSLKAVLSGNVTREDAEESIRAKRPGMAQ